jgi:hypothetical protein
MGKTLALEKNQSFTPGACILLQRSKRSQIQRRGWNQRPGRVEKRLKRTADDWGGNENPNETVVVVQCGVDADGALVLARASSKSTTPRDRPWQPSPPESPPPPLTACRVNLSAWPSRLCGNEETRPECSLGPLLTSPPPHPTPTPSMTSTRPEMEPKTHEIHKNLGESAAEMEPTHQNKNVGTLCHIDRVPVLQIYHIRKGPSTTPSPPPKWGKP